MEHGEISIKVIRYLWIYIRSIHISWDICILLETTFQLGGPRRETRCCVCFNRTGCPRTGVRGFACTAGSRRIEIVSPSDKHYDITEKAFAYLKAGTRLVWVIEPVAKTVMVYRSETDFTLLACEDTLTGEDVVEGFTCPVAQLFE